MNKENIESSEVGKEAIEFAEWIQENDYTTVKFKGETRWCTMEVADYGSSRDDAYMTLPELYKLFNPKWAEQAKQEDPGPTPVLQSIEGKEDLPEFLEYADESRDDFVRAINEQDWNTKMRTECESLLICFDQIRARLKPQQSNEAMEYIKAKYADHLGVKELDTCDERAVEWTLKNL